MSIESSDLLMCSTWCECHPRWRGRDHDASRQSSSVDMLTMKFIELSICDFPKSGHLVVFDGVTLPLTLAQFDSLGHMGEISQEVKRLKKWDFYPLYFGFS